MKLRIFQKFKNNKNKNRRIKYLICQIMKWNKNQMIK